MQHNHYKFSVCLVQPLRDSVITEIHDKLKRKPRQMDSIAFINHIRRGCCTYIALKLFLDY